MLKFIIKHLNEDALNNLFNNLLITAQDTEHCFKRERLTAIKYLQEIITHAVYHPIRPTALEQYKQIKISYEENE